jgi:cell division protease FtsH
MPGKMTDNRSGKTLRRTLVGLAALVLIGVGLWSRFEGEASEEVSFSAFLQRVERSPQDFAPEGIQIAISDTPRHAVFRGSWSGGGPFFTAGYLSEPILEKLRQANLPYQITAPPSRTWTRMLISALPLLVVLILAWLFARQLMSGGLGMARRLNRSPARRASKDSTKVTFADVAGVDEVMAEFQETIEFLRHPKKFTRLGGRIPKGALMIGPPGTGKTLLARAIAGEADVPFLSLSGSDFVEMFVGVGASRVRSLFEEAKQLAPCLIFIDEIDAVGRQRGSGIGGGHDEREHTLNQLLVEMDGFEPNTGVLVIAATNRSDVLDPALLRPGRFDRMLIVSRPDRAGRAGILQVHTMKTPLSEGVDLDVIARGTPGFVGADLANLVNEAALYAARADRNQVEMVDLERAKDKVLMGPERRSMVISPADQRAIATHQAGHALVGKLMADSDPVYKVSMIPRGSKLGVTQQLPSEDSRNLSATAARDQLALAMGGRAAEEIVLGQVTTSAADDIVTATSLARQMVCDWGMSELLGPVSHGQGPRMVFLGRDLSEPSRHSKKTAGTIDQEVRRLVGEGHDRARRVVRENLDKLKLIADALLEHETISSAEIDLLFAGKKLDRPALHPAAEVT